MDEILKVLCEKQKFAIYTHIHTDCDAMGSSLALRDALLQKNKTVDIFVNSEFPSNFKFYGDLGFVNKKSITGKYDASIILDAPNEQRIGKYKYKYKQGKTICIDHHTVSHTQFCDINYIEEASSTAEILFSILEKMNTKFTPQICKNLLSGIITDTGRFTHSSSSKTFEISSKLLSLGNLKIEEITTPLLNAIEKNVFSLLSLAYQKMEYKFGDKLGIIMFTKQDFEATNTSVDDLDIFPDIPLQLDCIKFAILASEDGQGYFRVSFRSKYDLSARQVAEVFGGGGHLNASGCKIFGEYDEVKQKLLDAVKCSFGWKDE